MKRKRIISTYHGLYPLEISRSRPDILICHWIADKIYRSCSNKIVSPSEYLLNKLNVKNKSIVIPNPFKIQEPAAIRTNHNREILLVTATNFNIKKKSDGLRSLIEAMNDIISEFNFVRLYIFGDGENLPKFRSENQHRENIFYMGFRSDFHSYLEMAHAYVHISGLDNQPYSVIEAMMLAKLIICNDLESIVEMLDPHNNYVVSLDCTSIANSLRLLINEVLENQESFKQKSQANKLFAMKRHSSEIVARKYLGLYLEILINGGTGNVK